jgi:hypothetical protein
MTLIRVLSIFSRESGRAGADVAARDNPNKRRSAGQLPPAASAAANVCVRAKEAAWSDRPGARSSDDWPTGGVHRTKAPFCSASIGRDLSTRGIG